jgi:hypothetical protein
MIARLVVLLVAASALISPSVAAAYHGTESGDGLGQTTLLLMGLAGVLLVAVIAFFILRDARRRAPETTTHQALDSEGRPVKGSRTPPKQRVKTNRAKAKVARQARKRNR